MNDDVKLADCGNEYQVLVQRVEISENVEVLKRLARWLALLHRMNVILI